MARDEDWESLAKFVETRRTELALSRKQVADRGGPSDYTLARIERAEPGPYRPKTLVQLENGLDMRPGLAKRILDGTATDAELDERWGIADSEGRTRARFDKTTGTATGEILPAIGDSISVPRGDAVARLAVELLGALVVLPTRTRDEQDLAEHLHEFVGARLGGAS
jgi:transcriptional regulator with XRE-family HTH domain